MKILHLIDHIGLGGAQKMLETIMTHHDKAYSQYLWSIKIKKHESSILSKCNQSSKKGGENLLSFMKNKEIEVLHVHLRSILIGVFIKMFIPRLTLVYHEHGYIFRSPFFLKIFFFFFARKIDGIISISSVTTQKLKSGLAQKHHSKIHQIYNFISLDTEIKENKRVKSNKADVLKIGFIGRLAPQKGVDILIRSLSEIPFPFTCIIAGDGSDIHDLKKRVKNNNLTNRVKFIGRINNPADFFSNIDVCIIPSRREPFGIVALEAQKCAVGVIASDVSGMNEILEHGKDALLFESENCNDLCDKILKIQDSKLRKTLIENGKMNADKYSFDIFWEKYTRMLTSVV